MLPPDPQTLISLLRFCRGDSSGKPEPPLCHWVPLRLLEPSGAGDSLPGPVHPASLAPLCLPPPPLPPERELQGWPSTHQADLCSGSALRLTRGEATSPCGHLQHGGIVNTWVVLIKLLLAQGTENARHCHHFKTHTSTWHNNRCIYKIRSSSFSPRNWEEEWTVTSKSKAEV